MQRYFAALTLVLLLGMVLGRVLLMRRKGIKAMQFGKTDQKDFLIPPFALFYFYIVFAAAFNFPTVSRQEFFSSVMVSWVGVLLCLAGFVPVVAESCFIWEEFPCWHRPGPSGQTCNDRHFCF
jgi:hypothetical protein